MKTSINYINKIIFSFLPETKFFAFKRFLLRLAGVKVGKNVRICSSVMIVGTGHLEIGDNTWIGHNVFISSGSRIIIGSNVDIAPLVYIGTGTHEIDFVGKHSAGKGYNKDIVISDGVWLCTRSTILPGIYIGKKSVIAAGALINKSCSEYSVYAGIPAKKIK